MKIELLNTNSDVFSLSSLNKVKHIETAGEEDSSQHSEFLQQEKIQQEAAKLYTAKKKIEFDFTDRESVPSEYIKTFLQAHQINKDEMAAAVSEIPEEEVQNVLEKAESETPASEIINPVTIRV